VSGLFLLFGSVSVSLTAAESSASAAEAFAPVAVAGLAVKPAVGSVVALGRLERKLFDFGAAFSAFQSESRHIVHLALGSVLIIHFSFRLTY